jgi:general nucleoside transport system ATP-binding protein
MATVLRVENVVKTFGPLRANDGITLELEKGEILAVLGENGAGKSTLMNVLYGLLQPDEGQIFVRDVPVRIESPKKAIELGIGMVHQHFMLVPVFSVVENVVLGLEYKQSLTKELQQAAKEIERLSKEYGLAVDPRATIERLPLGMQQRVEIIKALYRGADILIMDEPTAVLTPQEVSGLLATLKRLAGEGHTIIFISHKLEEVMEVADRVAVLHRGKLVGTTKVADTDKAALARMMVGRDIEVQVATTPVPEGNPVLQVEDLRATSDRGSAALNGVSFDIRPGEVLGVAGVDGNGQRELAEAIAGLRKVTGGRISVAGKDVTHLSRRKRQDLGIAYLPEDRRASGLILDFSICENLILEDFHRPPFSRTGILNDAAINANAGRCIDDFSIMASGPDCKAKQLSGGNQQKVVLARLLTTEPKVLVFCQPCRGLDVGATEYIHSRVLEQRERGAAVLLISTELDEVITLSDRIVVLFRGEVMGIVPGRTANRDELGLLMAGTKRLPTATAGTEQPVPQEA